VSAQIFSCVVGSGGTDTVQVMLAAKSGAVGLAVHEYSGVSIPGDSGGLADGGVYITGPALAVPDVDDVVVGYCSYGASFVAALPPTVFRLLCGSDPSGGQLAPAQGVPRPPGPEPCRRRRRCGCGADADAMTAGLALLLAAAAPVASLRHRLEVSWSGRATRAEAATA